MKKTTSSADKMILWEGDFVGDSLIAEHNKRLLSGLLNRRDIYWVHTGDGSIELDNVCDSPVDATITVRFNEQPDFSDPFTSKAVVFLSPQYLDATELPETKNVMFWVVDDKSADALKTKGITKNNIIVFNPFDPQTASKLSVNDFENNFLSKIQALSNKSEMPTELETVKNHYYNRGLVEAARNILFHHLKRTHSAETYVAYGKLLMLIGALDEVSAIQAQGLKRHPNDRELNYQVGFFRLHTKNEDEALEPLLKAWESAENRDRNAEALLKLREVYLARFHFITSRMGYKENHPSAKQALETAERIKALLATQNIPVLDANPVGCKLSLTMIVKNESKFIKQCLDSVKGLVDEIIVLDTGSSDNTVAIAKECGAKVFHTDWKNDFSIARNEALSHAAGDWILILDADEKIEKDHFPIFEEAMKHPQFGGYVISIINYMNSANRNQLFTHPTCRMFRRLPGIQWDGRIHEQIAASILEKGYQIATLNGAAILHYGYDPSVVADKNKDARTVDLLRQELMDDPNNAFQGCNLGNTYYCMGEYAKAVETMAKYAPMLLPSQPLFATSYGLWAAALIELGQYDEAIRVTDLSFSAKVFTPGLVYVRAMAYLRLDKYEDALQEIAKLRSMKWSENSIGDYTVLTYKADQIEGQALFGLGRYNEAEPLLLRAYEQCPEFTPVPFVLGSLYGLTGKLELAERYLRICADNSSFKGKALDILADLFERNHMYLKAADVLRELCPLLNDHSNEWHRWYICAEKSGDRRKVLQALEWLSTVQPLTAPHHVNWGRALADLGRWEEAINHFATAIDMAPNDPNNFFNAGDALYRLGFYRDAVNAYQTGLNLNPTHAEGWFVMGNALYQLGVYDGAGIAFRQALALSPNHTSALSNLRLAEEAVKETAA